MMQFGNLLSIRTRRISIFQSNPLSGPTKNLYLFGAMLISLLTMLIILHVPFFNYVFNTRYNLKFLFFYFFTQSQFFFFFFLFFFFNFIYFILILFFFF